MLVKEHVRDLIRQGNDYLFYTTRGVNVKTDSKAANLNHGLKFVQNLSRGPALVFVVPVFTTTLAAVFVPAILISGMSFVYFAELVASWNIWTKSAGLQLGKQTSNGIQR